MSRCFFSKPIPVEFSVTIVRDTIIGEAVSILNKIAEARYDGQNAKYVNDMQPEIDFEQDRDIIIRFFEEGITNIVRRIEPYIGDYGEDKDTTGTYVFNMVMPEDWRRNQEPAVSIKMREYLVHFIIAKWVEKVSMNDTAYSLENASALLRSIKGVCELRNSKLHRVWNGTY